METKTYRISSGHTINPLETQITTIYTKNADAELFNVNREVTDNNGNKFVVIDAQPLACQIVKIVLLPQPQEG